MVAHTLHGTRAQITVDSREHPYTVLYPHPTLTPQHAFKNDCDTTHLNHVRLCALKGLAWIDGGDDMCQKGDQCYPRNAGDINDSMKLVGDALLYGCRSDMSAMPWLRAPEPPPSPL